MAVYLGIETDGSLFCAPYEDLFIELYEKNWAIIASKLYFQSEAVDTGHKLRPRLVFWGYLSGLNSEVLNEKELNDVAKIAVSVELIHKASLLLDDYIDKDTTRHAKPAFYIEYGVERTIIFALNILSNALEIVNSVFLEYDGSKGFYYKSMREIINTLKDMSWGVLAELDLDQYSLINMKKIQEIMHYETGSLITNSLLMGHYLTCSENERIENILKSVGKDLGYSFQILNDLESFFSTKVNEHKGSLNNDINRFRKNICIPVLYSTMSIFEKRKYKLDNIEDPAIIIELLEKHKIRDIMMEEIDKISDKIKCELIENATLFQGHWLEGFINFIESVICVFKSRLD